MLERKTLPLKQIRLDGGTQVRASIKEEAVMRYAEDMEGGSVFPPMRVFFDGTDYWLADGFHRYHAALRIGVAEFPCEVDTGTTRDALYYGSTANNLHGQPMDNADKRKITMIFIEDFEWGQWSNSEIARQLHVSAPFVSKMRGESAPAVRKYMTPKGNVAEKRTPERKEKPATKPAKPAQDAPLIEPPKPADPPAVDHRQEMVDELIAQNETLTDRLAVQAMDATAEEKQAAEDLIKQLREEIRILKLEMNAVKSSRDKFQLENAQLKRQIAMQQRQLKAHE
jgi:ParB-like chromosome segregation protein Spo0J